MKTRKIRSIFVEAAEEERENSRNRAIGLFLSALLLCLFFAFSTRAEDSQQSLPPAVIDVEQNATNVRWCHLLQAAEDVLTTMESDYQAGDNFFWYLVEYGFCIYSDSVAITPREIVGREYTDSDGDVWRILRGEVSNIPNVDQVFFLTINPVMTKDEHEKYLQSQRSENV